ncbi:MAG: TrmB family transcriptional regulator sugar-binding domain-containing protein, partial [Nitrososphaera sp.]
SYMAGSFLIADGREYVGYLVDESRSRRILRITNASFVSSQLFLVNTIIDKALPAKQRIIDMVKGLGNEFIETIRDPSKTKSLVLDLINSAVYEIAILFSTKNSFIMAERENILDELGRASERGIKVKILVMRDEMVKEISDSKLIAPHEAIQVNYIHQFLPTKITTIIIDQSRSLAIEVNDDTKEAMQDAIGLSTYSNSDSTVFSNASFFESLWIQAELDKQNEARQAYFRLFKGFKLRDEVYDRRWSRKSKEGESKESQ